MKKSNLLNLSFSLLIVTIFIVSYFGLKTIKQFDDITVNTVDVYNIPLNSLREIEKKLVDIRYRMAAVSAGVLSFANVHYRLEYSEKVISRNLKFLETWEGSNKIFLKLADPKEYSNALEKKIEFFKKLNQAYLDKDRGKVLSLYQKQWPYTYSALLLPIKSDREKLEAFLDSSLESSLQLKRKLQMIWLIAAFIVLSMAIIIFLAIRKVFLDNEEMNKDHLNMSKLVMIGEMASSIVHEINNPLSVIQMNGQILKKEMAKSPDIYPKKIASVPESLLGGVDRILKIIAGLKTFAYQGTGGAEFEEFKEVSICKVIEDSLLFTGHKMRKHQIEFILNKPDCSYMTQGNFVQLSQVFINLINNAIDAIDELEDKWIKIDFIAHENMYEVRVTDSGNGISSDIQKKIFHTFYTTKKMGKGTGLGLSISRKILSNHKGHLELDRDNPNTCFKVFLPKI